ncbi:MULTISPECIES: alpha/beta fold hydrolase [Alphaproteobacteria]|uniref:Dihydrolipoamide acetyltransferase n=2 Tax=Alphaproteobacteria TaxID=28211 RepID=A0A512HEU3_9HYPH|nr:MULTISPECIES: alpha/beta fold hydrolase [Alphaproteobacteria]GEO83973.1 dihydrolipoamide acetyltransferase [Ciceribacter naphthalenivorans]GLR21149.1 dihydrolipoamide acetyltransferase [Ciceribacter naphthalenivorans]GLT04005.1 dihydrolipoamide acetyltransferase [Sphingomonas psychrolutea]
MALHAVALGDARKSPPLVLLHGFGGGAFIWRRVMAELGPAMPIIAYDMPGHAGSLHADGAGGAGKMAKVIRNDLDLRGVTNFHVAGHSLGGATAALLALKDPKRVLSATLMAPGGIGPAINHRLLSHYAQAETHLDLTWAMELMFGFNATIADDLIDDMMSVRHLPGAREALDRIFEAITYVSPIGERLQGELPLDALAALTMPIRVVWGVEDCVLPVMQADRLPDNVALTRIANAGHMLVDECPLAMAAILREMTSEASPG